MKRLIRKKILEERDELSEKEIAEKSNLIKKRLFALPEFKKAKTVMFFVSFGKEVFTHDMIKESLKKKRVCVPVVKDDTLIATEIKDFKELNTKNRYGILEPSKISDIDISEIDLVIVPGVAFDCAGYRVGYGKGYYDKFLNNFEKEKIALAFELQIQKELPCEDHDIVVDKVITEKRAIKCDQLLKWDM